jgi:L-amino acid N-acyltransferase YncA
MKIRLATVEDASGILQIYAPYIRDTSLTFETDVPTIEAFQQRIENYLQNWPWLLCDDEGLIAGYAYASRYRERVAYQWSVECSVYIHDQYHHAGIGKALYEALLAILKMQGYRNVYAVINLPNEASVRFHEHCGFSFFAEFPKVGYKLGQWKNVGWWQKKINDYDFDPEPPVKFSELNKDFLPELFMNKSQLIRK